jgi:hypothetical protein
LTTYNVFIIQSNATASYLFRTERMFGFFFQKKSLLIMKKVKQHKRHRVRNNCKKKIRNKISLSKKEKSQVFSSVAFCTLFGIYGNCTLTNEMYTKSETKQPILCPNDEISNNKACFF